MSNQLVESPPANARQIVPNRQPLTEMPPPQSIGALAGALATARDKCKAASKDAYNKHHEFWYASADEVIDTAKVALESSGLSLIPLRAKLTTLGSGNATIYALDRSFLLAHASGENVPLTVEGWPVMPERGRPLDKAYAIALTTSLAYTLRDLLQMRRGDPSDDVGSQDDRQTPTQRQPRQEQQREAPPPNPPATPQAEGSLTEEEYAEVVALARTHQRTAGEVKVLCQIMGVQTLDRTPRSRLPWLTQALAGGLTPAATVDRIGGVIDALGLKGESVSSRLQATYGVSSLAHLLPQQAQEVEDRLQAALSAKLEREKPLTAPAA